MSPRPDLSMSPQEVRALLQEPHVGVLSTIDRRGFPHSVGIYYLPQDASGGLEIATWVYGKSQKAVNVRREPRAALLVEAGEPYRNLRGVLVRGEARIVEDFDEVFALGRAIYERYFLPRTGIPLEQGPVDNIERQSAKRVALVLRAGHIASWDHGRSPSATGGP